MELDTTTTAVPIRILGIDAVGFESGNAQICAGPPPRKLPWLQDTPNADVWKSWGVSFEDIVVLDSSNVVVGVYSLYLKTLADSTTHAQLERMLVLAAH